MIELIGILIVLGLLALLVIGFITVLGWVFKSSSPSESVTFDPPVPASPRLRRCADCAATVEPQDVFCMNCGAPQAAKSNSEQAELLATKRVLLRLLNLRRIDEPSFQQIWQALEAELAPPKETALASTELVQAPLAAPLSETADQPPMLKPEAIQASPVSAPEPRPAPKPRRTFTEMLASFMEESSIRWGELIGGLLIVGSSLALVVSLWSEIAERPVLKFGVFMTLIAGLFLLGFYSAHRWRLPTTSRGVLLTATLLVPLNFLAIAAFGRTSAATVGILLAEALSWLVLAALVWRAARVIAAAQQRWLACGLMWASLTLLLAKHLAPTGLNWRSWLLLGALPVLGFVVSVGAAARAVRREAETQASQVYGLFVVFGVNLFAALLPLVLLQVRAASWVHALHETAPLVALLGLPALAIGWLLWRRLHNTAALARERTLAASLGLSGAALLVGSALLAFPFVDSLVVIALLNAALFGWAAWRYELRPARWMAMAQTVWAYLLLALLAVGRLSLGMEDARRLLVSVFSATSGLFLLIAFAVFFALSEWWRKQAADSEKHAARSQDFTWAAGLIGLVSLLLLTLHGFGVASDPQRLVWSLGFYALAAFVWAWRRETLPLVWLGWLLLFGVSAQTCVYKYGWPQGWQHAWIVSWSAVAVTASLLSLASVWRGEKARRFLSRPALQVAWSCALWASLAMWVRSRGLNYWYLAPLILVAVTCVVYAWRYTGQLAAAAGGVLFNAAATLGYVIWAQQHDSWFSAHEVARIAQVNLLIGAVYALGWLFVWWPSENAPPRWLRWQVHVLTGVALALLLAVALRLSLEPMWPSAVAQTFGDWLGWLNFAALAVCLRRARPAAVKISVHKLALGLLAFGTLLACTLHRFEQANWLGYHTLLVTCVATAWGMLWLVLLAERGALAEASNPLSRWLSNLFIVGAQVVANAATRWATGLSMIVVLLSLRGFNAPGGPWRSVVALAGIAALQIGLALARRNGAYFYAVGMLACLALTEWIFGYSKGGGSLLDVALLNVTALAGVALLSLWLELKMLRNSAETTASVPAFHQFAVLLLLLLTCLKVLVGLSLDFSGELPLPIKSWIAGLAFASVVALCLACLWDALFTYRFAVLFVTGLATAAAFVDRQNSSASRLLVVGALVLTGYALAVSQLWRQRAKLAGLLQNIRVPALTEAVNAQPFWLMRAQAGLVVGAVGFALAVSLHVISWPQRWLAASAALLAPLAVGWLTHLAGPSTTVVANTPEATAAQSSWRNAFYLRWQIVALVLELGALSAWIWTALNLQGYSHNANRVIALLTLLLTLALAFFGARAAEVVAWARLLNGWELAARRVLFGAGLFGLGLLALTLLFEWTQTTANGYVPLSWWAKAALTTSLLALCVLSVAFALWRGRDPFELQAELRGRYVYAAELFVVLLLAHLRLSAPWLFGGLFKQYWPLGVVALAFAGVGVAEQLRRRGRVILAEPLARTGVFLPLLPSLGFWLLESRVDYAGILLLVGLFYGVLSVWRRSFGFGLLAALAANGGWWHWLQRSEDFGFLAHPQVWLIPAALSVLAAAHFNREQLSREQLTAFRYAALITIYVSSTADIFIHGVVTSPWLPLVLAVLSVAGVLLGMLLQVRAYLFLGTAFLLLAVITMVWHAALSLGWNWLWYVSGIAFGVFILYLFAMFERRRAEFLGLMERLKTWEA